jgi:hypothetical protein
VFEDLHKGALHPKDVPSDWLRVLPREPGKGRRWVNTKGDVRSIEGLESGHLFCIYRAILRKATWRGTSLDDAEGLARHSNAQAVRTILSRKGINVPSITAVFVGNGSGLVFLNAEYK